LPEAKKLFGQDYFENVGNYSEMIKEVKSCSGSHFDPELVDLFLEIIS